MSEQNDQNGQNGQNDQKGLQNDEENRAEEARAMERVVNATRQVQVAFAALQGQFAPQGSGKPSKMALQTFDASLQALEDAQAAFDDVLNDLLDGKR